jgi:16S rRNA (cytosine967-C5)-methyltransferase
MTKKLDQTGLQTGLQERIIAAQLFEIILYKRQTLDEALQNHKAFEAAQERDKAFIRMLLTTTLRRLGTLRAIIETVLEKGWPQARRVETALLLGGRTNSLS